MLLGNDLFFLLWQDRDVWNLYRHKHVPNSLRISEDYRLQQKFKLSADLQILDFQLLIILSTFSMLQFSLGSPEPKSFYDKRKYLLNYFRFILKASDDGVKYSEESLSIVQCFFFKNVSEAGSASVFR
jgi:hypothetical protein